jgi:cysteine-rich repeat protein
VCSQARGCSHSSYISVASEYGVNGAVQAECMPVCKAGTYSKNGLDQSKLTRDSDSSASSNVDHVETCKPCELGRYQPDTKQRQCLACQRGKNTLEEGAWKEEQCIDKCGDGMKTDNEGCDDGNTADGDGCSSLCVPEAGSKCTHKAAEEAARRKREDEERAQQKLPPKPHSHADTEYGISWCRPVTCGDSAFDTSDDGSKVEQCDDGNSEDGDGCDRSCRIEAGARCEDNRDGQKSRCAKVVCGDSKVESSHDAQVNEECDDGNTNDGDGCSSSCAVVGGACDAHSSDVCPTHTHPQLRIRES